MTLVPTLPTTYPQPPPHRCPLRHPTLMMALPRTLYPLLAVDHQPCPLHRLKSLFITILFSSPLYLPQLSIPPNTRYARGVALEFDVARFVWLATNTSRPRRPYRQDCPERSVSIPGAPQKPSRQRMSPSEKSKYNLDILVGTAGVPMTMLDEVKLKQKTEFLAFAQPIDW
ncbi:hypothetical protein QCA50_012354 [Cerrena zonata]|uniref:Uncharacterized protein n=1 Tax=Cerrena zonata TaxID=2478898 RepID=A0AAW0FYK5_9APHY